MTEPHSRIALRMRTTDTGIVTSDNQMSSKELGACEPCGSLEPCGVYEPCMPTVSFVTHTRDGKVPLGQVVGS